MVRGGGSRCVLWWRAAAHVVRLLAIDVTTRMCTKRQITESGAGNARIKTAPRPCDE